MPFPVTPLLAFHQHLSRFAWWKSECAQHLPMTTALHKDALLSLTGMEAKPNGNCSSH